MRWNAAIGAIARCKRVSTGCGHKRRSAHALRWTCGVKPTPKAGNKPSPHFIVHGLDKPGGYTTVSVYTISRGPRTPAVLRLEQPDFDADWRPEARAIDRRSIVPYLVIQSVRDIGWAVCHDRGVEPLPPISVQPYCVIAPRHVPFFLAATIAGAGAAIGVGVRILEWARCLTKLGLGTGH